MKVEGIQVQNFPSEEAEIRVRCAGDVAGDLQLWRSTSDKCISTKPIILDGTRYNRTLDRFVLLTS